MDDPILSSYLREFKSAFGLDSLNLADLFEYFSAYCVFHRDFSEYTDLEETIVAGGHDTAVDAIGIFINEIFIRSNSQVDDISAKTRLDVEYAFLQSKTSKNLSAAEIGSFLQGVREFFSTAHMPINADIAEKRTVSDYVFSHSVKMRSKPKLHLFYCYTGRFKSDPNIVARAEAGRRDLDALNLFSDVSFNFLDASALQDRYQEINLRVEKEVLISEYASLPPISGIRQAYLGVMPCLELVKLLSNSDGRLQRSLFNENVRDFLSRNTVNDEITNTITSQENQGKLAALNNGITIVAKDIRIVGKKFTLSDFQIVNGCQTSNIIFDNRQYLRPDTSVPVKMIQVENKDLVNEIVRATNRQTEVKDEAFEVLSDYHKRLEKFFESIDSDQEHKIVYERRKRQYAGSNYTQRNIATLNFLISSFVSCVLENPVDAVDYYGVLLKRYSDKIFRDGHSMWPYLVSATILKEIERLCAGRARGDIWKFRFILALIIRSEFGRVPNLTDDKANNAFAKKILEVCHDRSAFLGRLSLAEKTLAEAIVSQGSSFDRRNAHQDRRFVESLFARYKIR